MSLYVGRLVSEAPSNRPRNPLRYAGISGDFGLHAPPGGKKRGGPQVLAKPALEFWEACPDARYLRALQDRVAPALSRSGQDRPQRAIGIDRSDNSPHAVSGFDFHFETTVDQSSHVGKRLFAFQPIHSNRSGAHLPIRRGGLRVSPLKSRKSPTIGESLLLAR